MYVTSKTEQLNNFREVYVYVYVLVYAYVHGIGLIKCHPIMSLTLIEIEYVASLWHSYGIVVHELHFLLING